MRCDELVAVGRTARRTGHYRKRHDARPARLSRAIIRSMAQGLPLWSPEVRERLNEYDVLLVVGMDLLRQYIYFEPVARHSGAHSIGPHRRRSVAARQELSA